MDIDHGSTLLRWEVVRTGLPLAVGGRDALVHFQAIVALEYFVLVPFLEREAEGLRRRRSPTEVTNISGHGFWLLVHGRELFLPFAEFSWFRGAPVSSILRVEQSAPEHLYRRSRRS